MTKSPRIKMTYDIWYWYDAVRSYQNWLKQNADIITEGSTWMSNYNINLKISECESTLAEMEKSMLIEFEGDISQLLIFKTLHNHFRTKAV